MSAPREREPAVVAVDHRGVFSLVQASEAACAWMGGELLEDVVLCERAAFVPGLYEGELSAFDDDSGFCELKIKRPIWTTAREDG